MNRWVLGARLRTLPAAVVPVAVGTAAALGEGPIRWWRAGAALVVALALQVGVNYANDYSDGVRGADDVRVGPARLVASRLASPASVKRAALGSFAVAALAGLALAVAVGPELIAVGAVAMLAAWGYTGGPAPYGYLGLGEVFVFTFFGVVATSGSAYVQLDRISGWSLVASVPVGALACALLAVNNLRDIPSDAIAGKRTLAVRLGDRRTRLLYTGLVAAAFVAVPVLAWWRWPALLALAALPLASTPIARVRSGSRGRDLIVVLGATGRLQLGFGALLALGLALGG